MAFTMNVISKARIYASLIGINILLINRYIPEKPIGLIVRFDYENFIFKPAVRGNQVSSQHI